MDEKFILCVIYKGSTIFKPWRNDFLITFEIAKTTNEKATNKKPTNEQSGIFVFKYKCKNSDKHKLKKEVIDNCYVNCIDIEIIFSKEVYHQMKHRLMLVVISLYHY